MRFQKLFLGCISLLATSLGWAQDPNFSQYYAAPLYLNPALATAESEATFGMVYRSQWRSISFPQKIGQFSGIIPLHSRKQSLMQPGGIGFALYNDAAGEGNNLQTTGIQAGAAYNLPLTRTYTHVLSFGMQLGLIQRSVDLGDFRWGSQYEPATPYFGFNPTLTATIQTHGLRDKKLYPVVHAGVVWHLNGSSIAAHQPLRGFLGFSASNLNQPDESLIQGAVSRLPMLFRAQAGLIFDVSERIQLMPNLLGMQQNDHTQINVGSYIAYQPGSLTSLSKTQLLFGGWYRVKDSFVLSTALVAKGYTIGFSYDITTSSLRYTTHGRGAWEVSLSYRIPKKTKTRRFATPLI